MMGGYAPGKATFRLLQELNRYFQKLGKVDEAMILAALFIDHFWQKCPVKASLPINEVVQSAGHLLTPYCTHFRLSHGLRHQARELLVGCYRFARGLGHRGHKRFLLNPGTPLALDMFRLWTEASSGDRILLATWQKALHTRDETSPQVPKGATRRTRRRPRRRRPSKPI